MKTSIHWLFLAALISGYCFGMDSQGDTDGTPPTEPYSIGSQDSAPLLSQDSLELLSQPSLGSFTVKDSLSLSAADSADTDVLGDLITEIEGQPEAELKKHETTYMTRLASLVPLYSCLDGYELNTTNEALKTVWQQYKNSSKNS